LGVSYQFVAVILIGLAISALGYFMNSKDYKGIIWSSFALYVAIGLMIALYALQHYRSILNPSPEVLSEQRNKSSENRLTDFRVIKDSKERLELEATYYYGGSLGTLEAEPVSVVAVPLRNDGTPVNMRAATAPVVSIRHRTIAELRLDSAGRILNLDPPMTDDETTAIKICLTHPTKGDFYCQTFPYKKVWHGDSPFLKNPN
jgi:hypothetical protein